MKTNRLPVNQARRGDVRIIILGVLAAQPRHGYDIIRHLEEKSGGAWRPSAGVIYPTLQQLQDEGLIASQKVGNKLVYSLTKKGEQEIAGEAIPGPWDTNEAMLRQVAWIKAMASELTQEYIRLLGRADGKTIDSAQTDIEHLIKAIKETK
jgi:DNA-binding PadR family transcriptional regulator